MPRHTLAKIRHLAGQCLFTGLDYYWTILSTLNEHKMLFQTLAGALSSFFLFLSLHLYLVCVIIIIIIIIASIY